MIPDPRFDFDPAIDVALYEAQKEIEQLDGRLQQQLTLLKKQQEALEKLVASTTEETALAKEINALSTKITQLRYKAMGTPETRQVGAWQSFEVTPMSQLKEARRKFQSSHQMPSVQELELIDQAREQVKAFERLFEDHMEENWGPFRTAMKKVRPDWQD